LSAKEPYEVHVEATFRARHRLAADGAPAEPHEHEWRVTVTAASKQLDRIAIVVDFRLLRQQMDEELGLLQGTELEANPALAEFDATPVGVGTWLLGRLQALARGETYRISRVAVGCDPGIDFVVSAEPT
jgi:6-pyruvoyl-tetrahydropterin synthase